MVEATPPRGRTNGGGRLRVASQSLRIGNGDLAIVVAMAGLSISTSSGGRPIQLRDLRIPLLVSPNRCCTLTCSFDLTTALSPLGFSFVFIFVLVGRLFLPCGTVCFFCSVFLPCIVLGVFLALVFLCGAFTVYVCRDSERRA